MQLDWNVNSNRGNDKSNGRKPVKSNSTKGSKSLTPSKKDLTIEDLSHSFIRGLFAPILDRNSNNNNNVLGLARIMGFKEDTIVYLENCFYGDGSPATDFLARFVAEKPDVTISELRRCLSQEGLPKEAIDAIASYTDLEIIDDILPLHLDDLASKLTTRGRTNRDWEYVALWFGYSEQIPLLKASVPRSVESATVELISLIKTQRPGMKVKSMIASLELIYNNEAANALKSQLNKKV